MHNDERRQILKEMAEEMKIPLYSRYDESEAANLLLISIPTLRRVRRSARISYIKISERKVAFFGFQILEYLLNGVEDVSWGNTTNETSNLETTTSQDVATAPLGAAHGLTPTLDKQSALASARRILNKPNKS